MHINITLFTQLQQNVVDTRSDRQTAGSNSTVVADLPGLEKNYM